MASAVKILGGLSPRALRWYLKAKMALLILFHYANRRREFVEKNGIRLIVRDPAISSVMFWLLHHDYEGHERALLERYVEPGDRILEIGAGVGYLGLVALKKGATRYAGVEANPKLLPLIAANIRENGLEMGSCQIINAIVSDGGHPESFRVHSDFWKSRIDEGGFDPQETLSTETLLTHISFEPTFLVIDIEGAEKKIKFDNFATCRKIMIEVHPDLIGYDTCCVVLNRIILLGFELRDFRGMNYFFEKVGN